MRTAIILFDLIGHRAIDRSQKVDTTVKHFLKIVMLLPDQSTKKNIHGSRINQIWQTGITGRSLLEIDRCYLPPSPLLENKRMFFASRTGARDRPL
jgi:hypothetical protein